MNRSLLSVAFLIASSSVLGAAEPSTNRAELEKALRIAEEARQQALVLRAQLQEALAVAEAERARSEQAQAEAQKQRAIAEEAANESRRRAAIAEDRAAALRAAAEARAAQPQSQMQGFRLKHAQAPAVAQLVTELYEQEVAKAGLRVVADPRINMLIVRGPKQLIADISQIVEMLDIEE